MKTVHSADRAGSDADPTIAAALAEISAERLRCSVETLAEPRHYTVDAARNRWTAEWIAAELSGLGLDVSFQGPYRNVVAVPLGAAGGCTQLVGAHYDSVPGTPGADDNASAVAAMLECARLVRRCAPDIPVCWVAFNCEEDGLVGSADFVSGWLPSSPHKIGAAHVLEMAGYCSHEPGSQRVPQGLPIQVPSVGDFIGVLGNGGSGAIVDLAMECARSYTPDLPAIGLKVMFGAEKLLPVLSRSDHDPFWRAGIPAVMWTDTAEFRNPHYHAATDTPDTLDYTFLSCATQTLTACLLSPLPPNRVLAKRV